MEQKIPDEIKLICFDTEAKVDKNYTPHELSNQYIYKVNHKDNDYIVKGYRIQLEQFNTENKESVELFRKGLIQVGEVFQEYYFTKNAGLFNTHIAQPLSLDYDIELPEEKDSPSCMHIQILFEYGGVALNNLKPTSVEMTYNLMRQSANALFLLHNLGVTHFDVNPDSMVYDKAKDKLQLVDMGSAFGNANRKKKTMVNVEGKVRSYTTAFAPPEILKMAEDAKISSLGFTPNAIDIYSWAMSFYSLILNRKIEEFESDYTKHKTGSEADYNVFNKLIENNLDAVKSKDSNEENMMETIKKLLADSLDYTPEKRPVIKEIIHKMKDCEKNKKVKLKYMQTELTNNKNLMDLLIYNPSEAQRKDSMLNYLEESKGERVELKCGHAIPKDYLINYVLMLFLKKQYYNYTCFCPMCCDLEKLKSLQLDSGCIYTNFGEKVKFNETDYVKCAEDKPRNLIDLCLLNDFISFKFASMMLSDYPEERRNSNLIDVFNEALKKEDIKDIAWILKSTHLVTTLDLTGNKIGDEGAKVIAEVLKSDKTLTELGLAKNNIGSEGTKALGEALMTNSTLTSLDLRDNKIGKEGTKAFAGALKVNKGLAKLDLRENKIGDESIAAISDALKENKKLVRINLGGNKMGVEGAKIICEALKTNGMLSKLGLLDNNIGVEGCNIIAEALKSNNIVAVLDLGGNKIGNEGMKAIAGLLKTNKTLTVLNLWNNNIDATGANYLSEALITNSALTHLELNGNKIGAEGMKFLGEALKTNKTLAWLSLTENKIGVEGTKIISELLKTNTALKKLELHGNNIGDEGTIVLSDILKVNKTLSHLNLRGNHIGLEGARAIAEMLKVNTTLTQLELSSNKIEDNGTRCICEALKTNTTLSQLKLRSNNIGYTGVVQIGEMLKSNKTLTLLDLHVNNVGDDGTKCIAEALKTNESLTQLDLRINNIGIAGAKFIGEVLRANKIIAYIDLRENKIAAEGREALRRMAERNKKVKISLY